MSKDKYLHISMYCIAKPDNFCMNSGISYNSTSTVHLFHNTYTVFASINNNAPRPILTGWRIFEMKHRLSNCKHKNKRLKQSAETEALRFEPRWNIQSLMYLLNWASFPNGLLFHVQEITHVEVLVWIFIFEGHKLWSRIVRIRNLKIIVYIGHRLWNICLKIFTLRLSRFISV